MTARSMNGAESLVRTLVGGDVTVSFTNPGTSEMHFVAALDRVDGMRCVLCLHENVATGAADGYYRIAGKPASTLLHLGPGLANGLSNLHNLKRARSGVVNIVGEHATYHRVHDAPLTSDIEAIARTMSDWVRVSETSKDVARDGAEAITVARTAPGRIASLILPADTAWTEGTGPHPVAAAPAPAKVEDAAVEAAARAVLSGEATTLFLGAGAMRDACAQVAARIAAKTGVRLVVTGAVGRIERGVGRVPLERVAYPVDIAVRQLADVKRMVMVGSTPPVAFFAYPGKPSHVHPPTAEVTTLAAPEEDLLDALTRLAERVGALGSTPVVNVAARPPRPSGAITPETLAAALGWIIPENAIITDESVSTGRGFFPMTQGAPPHDWMQLTGGSIGEGLPLAVGAATAAPDRKVIALQADGSAMYSLQALWTMARERLDVTVCIWANRAYAILKAELLNVGAENPGRKAHDMLSLGDPDLDWVRLARGMGVDGTRVETIEAFIDVVEARNRTRGPFLVEVVL